MSTLCHVATSSAHPGVPLEKRAPPFPPSSHGGVDENLRPSAVGLRGMKRLRRLLYIKAYNAKPDGTTIDERSNGPNLTAGKMTAREKGMVMVNVELMLMW